MKAGDPKLIVSTGFVTGALSGAVRSLTFIGLAIFLSGMLLPLSVAKKTGATSCGTCILLNPKVVACDLDAVSPHSLLRGSLQDATG